MITAGSVLSISTFGYLFSNDVLAPPPATDSKQLYICFFVEKRKNRVTGDLMITRTKDNTFALTRAFSSLNYEDILN
jgi:hypothetical protein